MSVTTKISGSLFFLVLFLPTSLFAQAITTTGEISGEVGAVEGPWFTLYAEGFGSTSNHSSFLPGFTTLTVQGHKAKTPNLENAVSVSFTLLESGAIQEPNVVFLHEGSIRDFYESTEGSVTVDLQKLEKVDDTYFVEGTATGSVFRTKIEGIDVSQDTSDKLELNLFFRTEVFPEA